MEIKNMLGYILLTNEKRSWRVEVVGSLYYLNFKKKNEKSFKSLQEVISFLNK